MYHEIQAIGNLGRDPEMRYTPSGQAVCNFSIACNRKYSNSNGEQVKETLWLRVETWGKQAEICNQYLKKGSMVLVVGRLVPDKSTGGPRMWKTKEGEAAASFEVSATVVRFLSKSDESMTDVARDLGGVEEPMF